MEATWLDVFRYGVLKLEKKEFFDIPGDEFDLEEYLLARSAIHNEMHLTDAQQKELAELDERFKKALYPALYKAKLAEWYQTEYANMPPEEWWHVREEKSHA